MDLIESISLHESDDILNKIKKDITGGSKDKDKGGYQVYFDNVYKTKYNVNNIAKKYKTDEKTISNLMDKAIKELTK